MIIDTARYEGGVYVHIWVYQRLRKIHSRHSWRDVTKMKIPMYLRYVLQRYIGISRLNKNLIKIGTAPSGTCNVLGELSREERAEGNKKIVCSEGENKSTAKFCQVAFE